MKIKQYPGFARALFRETTLPKIETKQGELTLIALGLAEESGELIKELHKFVRAKNSPAQGGRVAEELSDLLFYVSVCAEVFGLSLGDLVDVSVDKMNSRLPGSTEKILARLTPVSSLWRAAYSGLPHAKGFGPGAPVGEVTDSGLERDPDECDGCERCEGEEEEEEPEKPRVGPWAEVPKYGWERYSLGDNILVAWITPGMTGFHATVKSPNGVLSSGVRTLEDGRRWCNKKLKELGYELDNDELAKEAT